MKKLVFCSMLFALTAPLFAQEAEQKAEAAQPQETSSTSGTVSPFAIAQWPACQDVIGLRLTIPFSTAQEGVTGIDLGFWGQSVYFEGIQINIIRNDVQDRSAGFQVGIYNSVNSGEMFGIQAGLWNEANSLRGIQAGLVNVSGETQGLQVGLVNLAETMYGYQVGLINVIRDAELQFFPIVNIGF